MQEQIEMLHQQHEKELNDLHYRISLLQGEIREHQQTHANNLE